VLETRDRAHVDQVEQALGAAGLSVRMDGCDAEGVLR